MKTPLFLGIEGGGTRTVAILADEQDEVAHRIESGPANLKLLSDDKLATHLSDLAERLPEPTAICIGLAGLRTDTDCSRVLQLAGRIWPRVPCRACSDLDTALAAAPVSSPSPPAQVLVLSGTGSCCYGRTLSSDRISKAGGWGHLLDDDGSGYTIALQSLKEVIRQFDRTAIWPRLGQSILRALQLNHPDELIGWVNAAEKKDVAALALEVFEAWARRDTIATLVIERAADDLVESATACARRLVQPREGPQFIFAGGVLLNQPRFLNRVSTGLSRMWPRAVMTPLERESAWGAVRLARAEWAARGGLLAAEAFTNGSPLQNGSVTTASVSRKEPQTFYIPESTALSPTEQRNPRSERLHELPLSQAIEVMLTEEAKVPDCLMRERERIERCIQMIVRTFRRGGRLFYAGAGTSGRLGALDASECPPTFRAPAEQVQAIMAGGQQALWQSIEGAEDSAPGGADAIRFRGVGPTDILVGIAASGRTPFVWGALAEARRHGARTILVCFNPHLKIARSERPDVLLAVGLGPEILTGSTRLKAGTATKLILNLFSTLSMVRMGKVISNLMVDMNPSNQKLRQRAVRIVRELTGVPDADAAKALEKSGWVIKRALRRLKR